MATTISTKSKEETVSSPDHDFFGLLGADNVNALLAYWDTTQVCRFANNAYIEWFGLTRDELVGKLNMKQLLGPEYKFTLPYITEALTGKLKKFECEIVLRNGELRQAHIGYYPHNIEGEVKGVFSFVTDISRQKDEERKLSQFEAIVESSADAIISKKLDGTILTWNQGAKNILGYTSEEVLGKHISILFPENILEQETNLLAKLLKGENIERYETTRVRKDQKIINVLITLSSIKDKHGKIVGISKILRDNTKNKRAQKKLRGSNDRSKIFISQSPNAIAMFDKQMRYLAVSAQWVEDYKLTG